MTGIIKNQILKHLSKFAKNLSSNSINVNTLRGEGELFNLELNEKVLTDLLELPNWMLISQASVNKVSIKIQWTKLKTTPIHLTLDEVYVQMETCQELRPHGAPNDLGAYRSGSKYGFVEKVIDGMTVTVDSVYVKFNSPSFTTTFHLTRLILSSKSPSWKPTDLRLTRLKDLNQQHVLIFKELLWQTLKIESKPTNSQMTPIRLISNQSCCRITVKKKLSDCSVVGCRLVLISEDSLWVLTDSQILSAYHLVESMSGIIKKATEQSQKTKAARKLESIPAYYNNPLHSYGTSTSNTTQGDKEKSGLWNSGFSQAPSHIDQNSMNRFQVFKKFDVVETSYHFYSEKIELHLCDDPGSGRSSYPDLQKGGTLQVNILKIKLDYYPYHLALGDRTHWIKYQEGSPYQWTKLALNYFKNSLYDFFNSKHTSHTPLGRASPHASPSNPQQNTKESGSGIGDNSQPTKAFISNQFKRLMSTCFLLTCKNLVVYKVALSKRKVTQIEMLTTDKTRLCLPEGTSFVHAEFSSYYYPGGFNFPVPPPKIYTHVSPFKLDVDLMSLLWLNAFACNLKEKTVKNVPTPPYIDVYTEILMPRIIIKPIRKCEKQKGRPRAMQILASRLIVSNVRSPDPTEPGSKARLFSCLEEAQKGPLFFASGFPSRKGDKQPIPSKFLWHAEGSDIISRPLEATPPDEGYSPAALWTEPRDVLFFFCDPVWVEYLERIGDEHQKHPLPFVDPFPISIWIHIKEMSIPSLETSNGSCNGSVTDVGDMAINGSCSSIYSALTKKDMEVTNEASLHGLIYIPNLVRAQLTHLQLLFLMRILDAADEFSTFLTEDTNKIQSKQDSILISAVFPQISASLIFPPCISANLGLMSPLECDETFPQMPSSLGLIKELTSRGADDIKSPSKSSVPSLSPPPNDFSPSEALVEIEEEGEGRLAKSQSDGCLPNTLEFPSVNISRSGEDLNTPTIRSTTPQIIRPEPDRKNSSSTSISLSSSVRRGLTSGLHTLKNTLESSVGSKLPANDDASDTASIHSDLSNDSDTFVMLYLDNEHDTSCSFVKSEFKTDIRTQMEELDIEAATEVIEDNVEDQISSSEPSEASTSSKIKQYIGAITFKIGNGQLILESEGHNSFIKFQAASLDHEEYSKITMEEFQKKFHHSKSYENHGMSLKPCSIRVRLNTEGVLKVTDGTKEELPCYLLGRYTCSLPVHRNSSLEADVTGLSMSIYMSTLMELLELIEDEIVPLPMPMKIKLEKIDFDIVDIKSKLSKNSQKYLIPRMLVDRDEASAFTILPIPYKESVTNLSISSSSSLAPVPSFSDPSLTSAGNLNPSQFSNSVPASGQCHEKCLHREEELIKELERVNEQLSSSQRENMNLMKALKILHEDRNVRK